MSARGGVPECTGTGYKAVRNPYSARARGVLPAYALCPHCRREVAVNYNGTLRWHTPNPKRKD
jgi:hypothetical protein